MANDLGVYEMQEAEVGIRIPFSLRTFQKDYLERT